jgi:hypothetical protein
LVAFDLSALSYIASLGMRRLVDVARTQATRGGASSSGL